MWGSYDPIEPGPSDPQKWGLYGCSVKKTALRANFGPKMALEPPQELVQQHDQHENVVFLVSRHDGTKKNGRCPQKLISGQKTSFFDPNRAILGNWVQKTAHRVAKRPHTRIPKVSRVTSGYGGLMIPLIRIHLTPKNGGYMGVA